MRYHRRDVVIQAVAVLDTWGLADLTMRRLGAELGVQPSAIYHHFTNKQTLLAAVADEVLTRGARPVVVDGGSWDRAARDEVAGDGGSGDGVAWDGGSADGVAWEARAVAVCGQLRDAMLAYRDGAELVSTVHAFGLGARAPYDALVAALADAGCAPDLARPAARTLLHFVFGHTCEEQTHLQAGSAGAIPDEPGAPRPPGSADFDLGLALILDGLRVRVGPPVGAPVGVVRHPTAPTRQ